MKRGTRLHISRASFINLNEVFFMYKKLLSILICILLALPVTAYAESKMPVVNLSAPSSILVEAGSKKVLCENNSHQKRACASVTKVMTLLLVMEALDCGRLSPDTELSASAHAASMGGSDIWLEEGERMTVRDLIKATAVASANDAAVVLAEELSGSEADFVAEMNKKARSLKMNDTVFKNCNGLDEKGHLTSAYDVAIMSCELIKHKRIFDYTSIWLDNLRGGKTQIVNTNKLLKTYDGITGLKTGTTDDAGCCMSATAERGGLSLVAVVLGCKSGTERFADSARLLDYGFQNFVSEKPELPARLNKRVKVSGGMTGTVRLECGDPGTLVLRRSGDNKLNRECIIKKDLKAPIHRGDKLGEVNYYSGKRLLKSLKITAADSVEAMSFGLVAAKMLKALTSL